MVHAKKWMPSEAVGVIFKGDQPNWKRENTILYMDPNRNGNLIQAEPNQYELWEDQGRILWINEDFQGDLYASYDYSNFDCYTLVNQNKKVNRDALSLIRQIETNEGFAYLMSNRDIATDPEPVIYISEGQNPLPRNQYHIDYEKGIVWTYQTFSAGLYADYTCFVKNDIEIEDFDTNNGILYTKSDISFRDDIYAQYIYKENHYEYKGYFDEIEKRFIHLDLNPSIGHFSTLPTEKQEEGRKVVQFEDVPSNQLIGKNIYVYLVPQPTEWSVRHCFGKENWKLLYQSHPEYVLLSRLLVKENATIEDCKLIDTRQRGGGLHKDIPYQTIAKESIGKQQYFDIGDWNGVPYYKNGNIILSLPKSILKENGGLYTESEVREKIGEHLGFGIFIILEFHEEG